MPQQGPCVVGRGGRRPPHEVAGTPARPGSLCWSGVPTPPIRCQTGWVVVLCLVDRDVVRVAGPDAATYLQGQLSQDVLALDVGSSARSFVLQPSGKVDAWARVTRAADDAYVLDTDGGHGGVVLSRLRRFLLRTKADVDPLDWRCVAFRGTGARKAADDAGIVAELRLPLDWPGVEGVDLLGPDIELPSDPPAGVGLAARETYEALRIGSGVPVMGAELTERTIPAEAGPWVLDASVSFTKGCFTGQELVARIDSRGGKVPRQLRGLIVDGQAVPPPGAIVRVDGDEIGRVTSSARAEDLGGTLGGPVAMAYIGRAVVPPQDGIVTWPGGEASVSVRTLPLGAGA